MKRALVRTASFNRAFRKFVRRQPDILDGIERTLQLMEIDVFVPSSVPTNCLENCLDSARAHAATTAEFSFQLTAIRGRTPKSSSSTTSEHTIRFIKR